MYMPPGMMAGSRVGYHNSHGGAYSQDPTGYSNRPYKRNRTHVAIAMYIYHTKQNLT